MKMVSRCLLGGLVTLLSGTLTRAQSALYAEHKGEYRVVRRVVRSDPYVDVGSGKLVRADGSKYGLAPVPEYAPLYVSVRNLKVFSRGLELVNSGAEINREFDFQADFESPYALKNVFVVLDMNSEDAGKLLFVREVGDLEPRNPKPIHIVVQMSQRIGAGKYVLHVFSDGAEVFHSEMPFNRIERKLDDIVRHRIAGVTDAAPQPFVGPAPEYPAKLRRAKAYGTAVIHFTIGPTGRVLDPVIQSASDPVLGESALVAARQWRFLPKVKNGKPVSAAVNMPFVFGTPPPAASAASAGK